MITKKSTQTESFQRIIKDGDPVVNGTKNCKTFRKALQTLIGKYYKQGNTELEFYTRGILNLYNKYHPEKITEQNQKGWKGKSGITNIEKFPDKVIITRFQKSAKGEIPKEVRIEIEKYQLEAVLNILFKLNLKDKIKTKAIAMAYSNSLNLNHKNWIEFFGDRKEHNLLTNILSFLDEEGIIKYKGGVSELITKSIKIQEVLE